MPASRFIMTEGVAFGFLTGFGSPASTREFSSDGRLDEPSEPYRFESFGLAGLLSITEFASASLPLQRFV